MMAQTHRGEEEDRRTDSTVNTPALYSGGRGGALAEPEGEGGGGGAWLSLRFWQPFYLFTLDNNNDNFNSNSVELFLPSAIS